MLETRRRFVKVRTAQGLEGWTDATQLLTPQQMEDLGKLAESSAKLPSQGVATVFDTLNVHSEPSRPSPSFFQIPENGSAEVIAHRIAPRIAPAAPATATPVRRATASKKSKAKEKEKKGLPPPPRPAPPALPANWEALERPHASDLPGYKPPEPKPVSYDDWSLIRTKDGKAGWVLSRMLTMSIPDEVAQYAEGRRITSYLPLGEVQDKENGTAKPNWLWTTIGSGQFPYEFDSFRVFVWSVKRHRYETAYIERNVEGYYPAQTFDLPDSGEKAFSLILRDKDGKLYKKTFAFSGYRVHMTGKIPYDAPAAAGEVRASKNFDVLPASAPAATGWKEKFSQLRKRLTGR